MKHQRIWCPKIDHIRLRAWPSKPPLKVFLELIKEIAEEDGLMLKFKANKVPDAQ